MIFLNEDRTPLDAVIFDLGNVLLDYNPRRFMAELGIDVKNIDRLMEIFPHSQEWQDLDQNLISDDEFLESALRKEPSLRREILLYHKHCMTGSRRSRKTLPHSMRSKKQAQRLISSPISRRPASGSCRNTTRFWMILTGGSSPLNAVCGNLSRRSMSTSSANISWTRPTASSLMIWT